MVTMAAMKEHGIPHDKVNVHGGAMRARASDRRVRRAHPGDADRRVAQARQEARRRVAVHRRRRGDGDGDRTRLTRSGAARDTARHLARVRPRVRRPRGDARAQRALPRVAHACAGPRGGLRVARGNVDRLPAVTCSRRRSACRPFSPRCPSPTTRSASPARCTSRGSRGRPGARPTSLPDAAARRAAVPAAQLYPRRPGHGGPESESGDVPARALSAVRRSGARQCPRPEPVARRDAARHRRGGRFAVRARGGRRAPLARVRVPRGASGPSAFLPACSPRSRRGSRWTTGVDVERRRRTSSLTASSSLDGAVLGRHVHRAAASRTGEDGAARGGALALSRRDRCAAGVRLSCSKAACRACPARQWIGVTLLGVTGVALFNLCFMYGLATRARPRALRSSLRSIPPSRCSAPRCSCASRLTRNKSVRHRGRAGRREQSFSATAIRVRLYRAPSASARSCCSAVPSPGRPIRAARVSASCASFRRSRRRRASAIIGHRRCSPSSPRSPAISVSAGRFVARVGGHRLHRASSAPPRSFVLVLRRRARASVRRVPSVFINLVPVFGRHARRAAAGRAARVVDARRRRAGGRRHLPSQSAAIDAAGAGASAA